MARKADVERLDTILTAIIDHPGCKAGEIAREVGVDNKTMMRSLPLLEARGDLLVEDEHGRLTWLGAHDSEVGYHR